MLCWVNRHLKWNLKIGQELIFDIFIIMNLNSEQTFRSYTTRSQEVIRLIRVRFRVEPIGLTVR